MSYYPVKAGDLLCDRPIPYPAVYYSWTSPRLVGGGGLICPVIIKSLPHVEKTYRQYRYSTETEGDLHSRRPRHLLPSESV